MACLGECGPGRAGRSTKRHFPRRILTTSLRHQTAILNKARMTLHPTHPPLTTSIFPNGSSSKWSVLSVSRCSRKVTV